MSEHGDENTILLRSDSSEFTADELAALCSMNLEDPSDEPVGESIAPSIPKGEMKQRFSDRHNRRKIVSFQQLLSRELLVGGTDSIADAVFNTQQLHVGDKGLRDTLLLECCLNATHIYAQHNEIVSLEGLSLLVQLTVLVVHHNSIESLNPLASLSMLSYLDARFNAIAELHPADDLPCSLRYLSLLGNPCCPTSSSDADKRTVYQSRVLEACPLLEMLDDVPCSNEDGEGEEEEEEEEAVPPVEPPRPHTSGGLRSRLQMTVELSKSAPPPPPPPPPPVQEQPLDGSVCERLCTLFAHRASCIRRGAEDHAVLTQPRGDDDVDHSGEVTSDLARQRQVRSRLYADLRFAQQTETSREQQRLASTWSEVDSVVRTRVALVGQRRERMKARREEPSAAYTESLALLERESLAKNLDKYRGEQNLR